MTFNGANLFESGHRGFGCGLDDARAHDEFRLTRPYREDHGHRGLVNTDGAIAGARRSFRQRRRSRHGSRRRDDE